VKGEPQSPKPPICPVTATPCPAIRGHRLARDAEIAFHRATKTTLCLPTTCAHNHRTNVLFTTSIADFHMDDNKNQSTRRRPLTIENSSARAPSCVSANTTSPVTFEVVSTGSLGLDVALASRLPRGRVVEIYGPDFFRQDDVDPAGDRRNAEAGRYGCLHRCRSTRSIRSTRKNSASTFPTCSSHNRTTASRPWKSPTCWCVPAR